MFKKYTTGLIAFFLIMTSLSSIILISPTKTLAAEQVANISINITDKDGKLAPSFLTVGGKDFTHSSATGRIDVCIKKSSIINGKLIAIAKPTNNEYATTTLDIASQITLFGDYCSQSEIPSSLGQWVAGLFVKPTVSPSNYISLKLDKNTSYTAPVAPKADETPVGAVLTQGAKANTGGFCNEDMEIKATPYKDVTKMQVSWTHQTATVGSDKIPKSFDLYRGTDIVTQVTNTNSYTKIASSLDKNTTTYLDTVANGHKYVYRLMVSYENMSDIFCNGISISTVDPTKLTAESDISQGAIATTGAGGEEDSACVKACPSNPWGPFNPGGLLARTMCQMQCAVLGWLTSALAMAFDSIVLPNLL